MKLKYFILSLLLAPLVALATPNQQQKTPQQDPRCKPSENKFMTNTFVKGKQGVGQGNDGFADISGTAWVKQGPDNKPKDVQVFTPHGTTFEDEFQEQNPCPKE